MTRGGTSPWLPPQGSIARGALWRSACSRTGLSRMSSRSSKLNKAGMAPNLTACPQGGLIFESGHGRRSRDGSRHDFFEADRPCRRLGRGLPSNSDAGVTCFSQRGHHYQLGMWSEFHSHVANSRTKFGSHISPGRAMLSGLCFPIAASCTAQRRGAEPSMNHCILRAIMHTNRTHCAT